jgi:hypothetical protein
MIADHPADGPGSLALSGPGGPTMITANDNRPGNPGLRGLVLSAERGGDGTPALAIRALDRQGLLGAPLLVTRSDREIIALWRGFGRDFNLPLFLREPGGAMTPVAPPARIFARSRGSALAGRRPRFLVRRKGPAGIIPAIAGLARREG